MTSKITPIIEHLEIAQAALTSVALVLTPELDIRDFYATPLGKVTSNINNAIEKLEELLDQEEEE